MLKTITLMLLCDNEIWKLHQIWKLHYENFNILRNAPKIMVKSVTQFESPNYHHKKQNASALQIIKTGSNFFYCEKYISWT